MKCELKTVKQYEMAELVFKGGEPEGSAVTVDLQAFFSMEKKQLQSKAFMPGKVYTRFVFYRKKQVLIRIV